MCCGEIGGKKVSLERGSTWLDFRLVRLIVLLNIDILYQKNQKKRNREMPNLSNTVTVSLPFEGKTKN